MTDLKKIVSAYGIPAYGLYQVYSHSNRKLSTEHIPIAGTYLIKADDEFNSCVISFCHNFPSSMSAGYFKLATRPNARK
jgi:hypothetical protein